MNTSNIQKNNEYIFIAIIFSIFLIPFYMRDGFVGNLAVINFLFLGALIVYMYINKKIINIYIFLFITLIIGYIFIVDYIGNKNPMFAIIRSIFIVLIPMYMLTIRLPEEEMGNIYEKSLKIINIFVIIIFTIGVVDPLINFCIMNFIGKYVTPALLVWIKNNTNGLYRYTSYMGHALVTKEIFLIFYLLNSAYNRKFKKVLLNNTVIMFISLVGILLTGSKSGVILILICFLFLNTEKEISKKVIISLFIIITPLLFGGYDTVLERFKTQTLTTGRYESMQYINDYNFLKYSYFSGYGEYMDRHISVVVGDERTTALLEYPMKILVLKYGIVCTILIAISIFIVPTIYFIKKKQFYILSLFLIKVIDLNTYNGLVTKADNMIMFVLFTVLLMGISQKSNSISTS